MNKAKPVMVRLRPPDEWKVSSQDVLDCLRIAAASRGVTQQELLFDVLNHESVFNRELTNRMIARRNKERQQEREAQGKVEANE